MYVDDDPVSLFTRNIRWLQVVTDEPIGLADHDAAAFGRVDEIVVPSAYQTKSGAKFKSRALQYCLEDEVNRLSDDDWIVHLGRYSVLSRGSP